MTTELDKGTLKKTQPNKPWPLAVLKIVYFEILATFFIKYWITAHKTYPARI